MFCTPKLSPPSYSFFCHLGFSVTGHVDVLIQVADSCLIYLCAGIQKLLKGDREEISVVGWLTAGACAGMTSTLVSYIFEQNLENLQQCAI